jgi:NitT/TauT family transport system substrate-binding protein
MTVVLLFCPPKVQAEKMVLMTSWTAQAQFAGYYVAYEKGFYKEAGLDIEITHPTLATTPLVTLQREQPDAIMLSLMSAMDLISQGIPLVNIFQDSMNSSNLLISRWNNDPMKMKGKKVAIFNGDPNYLAYIVSKKEKLNYNIVRCTSHINLFLSGAIDATMATSYNEYLQLLQSGFKLGDESIYRFSQHGYNIQEQGVYVKRSYYRDHAKACQKFAAATRLGWEWVAEHPEEALKIVMKYVRSDHAATNLTLQRRMLQEVLNLQLDADSKKREFRVRRDMVQKANKLMIECGLLKRAVTFEELTVP